jgi:hypothetical protein
LVALPSNSTSRSEVHRASFGRGWTVRSYSKDVSPDRKTRRTVFLDTPTSLAISLIVLPLTKCSRRIRAIVSPRRMTPSARDCLRVRTSAPVLSRPRIRKPDPTRWGFLFRMQNGPHFTVVECRRGVHHRTPRVLIWPACWPWLSIPAEAPWAGGLTWNNPRHVAVGVLAHWSAGAAPCLRAGRTNATGAGVLRDAAWRPACCTWHTIREPQPSLKTRQQAQIASLRPHAIMMKRKRTTARPRVGAA